MEEIEIWRAANQLPKQYPEDQVPFTRQLRMDRIAVEELINLLDTGRAPLIPDVRSAEIQARDGVIPGSLPAHPEGIHSRLTEIPTDVEIVVYCACPNEASADRGLAFEARASRKSARFWAALRLGWRRSARWLNHKLFLTLSGWREEFPLLSQSGTFWPAIVGRPSKEDLYSTSNSARAAARHWFASPGKLIIRISSACVALPW